MSDQINFGKHFRNDSAEDRQSVTTHQNNLQKKDDI